MTDPRALIAEGRAYAADVHPWQPNMPAGLQRWLRTNLSALLTGYASALDEVERLKAVLETTEGILRRVRDGEMSWETKCDDARARVATLEADRERLHSTLTALRHEVAFGRTHNLLSAIDAMIGAPCPMK